MSGGPGQAVEPAALGVHRHGDDPLAARGLGQVLELLRLHVIGEEMAARIGLPALRRDADLLHAVDDAVVPDVGREIELAALLHEVDVRFALHDRLGVLLAARLGEVAQQLDLVRDRVIAEHLGADVEQLGRQDIVDLAVAARAHAVVGVVPPGQNRSCAFVRSACPEHRAPFTAVSVIKIATNPDMVEPFPELSAISLTYYSYLCCTSSCTLSTIRFFDRRRKRRHGDIVIQDRILCLVPAFLQDPLGRHVAEDFVE